MQSPDRDAATPRQIAAALQERAGFMVQAYEDSLAVIVDGDKLEGLLDELERQQELWSTQSKVISALAAEVPDDVRARVLAPLRAET